VNHEKELESETEIREKKKNEYEQEM